MTISFVAWVGDWGYGHFPLLIYEFDTPERVIPWIVNIYIEACVS